MCCGVPVRMQRLLKLNDETRVWPSPQPCIYTGLLHGGTTSVCKTMPLPIRTTPAFPMHQCLDLKLKSLKSTTEAIILKIHSDKCLWAFAIICIHTHYSKLRLRLRLPFSHQCFAACVCNVLQFSKAILTNYLLEALYSGAMPVLLFCISVYNFLFLCAKNQRFWSTDWHQVVKSAAQGA